MKAAIFDIDDTLLSSEDDDEDDFIESARNLLEKMQEDEETLTVLLTARAEEVRQETLRRLDESGIDFDRLYMRPENSFGVKDENFKQNVLNKLREEGLDISFAVDDKSFVADMWRDNNVTCLKMPEKNFLRHRFYRKTRKIYPILPGPLQKAFQRYYRYRYRKGK